MRRSLVGALFALLFACSCGNAPEPETPNAERVDECSARADARTRAERGDAGSAGGEPYGDAAQVIYDLAPRLYACRGYDRKTDACVIIQTRIAKTGAVVSTAPLENGGFSEDVTYCIADVLRTARFAGGERDATLFVPIVFNESRRWAR